MTEAEEVAESLLPLYLKTVSLHSVEGVKRFVSAKLSATESYSVIDAVTDAMVKLAMPDRTRADGKLGHAWFTGKQLGMPEISLLYKLKCCRDCGIVRGPENLPDTPCKGSQI